MKETLYSLIVISLILASIFIFIRIKWGGVYGLLAKIVASISFVATGVVASLYTSGALACCLIILGLIFGLIGDILLDLKVIYPDDNSKYLNSGMLAFSIGHIFFFVGIIFAIPNSVNLLYPIITASAVALVFVAMLLLLEKPLKLDFGKFRVQSAAYGFILMFMTALTIYLSVSIPYMFIMAIGMTLFLLSDLVLSLQYFGGKQSNKTLIAVNHLLYYGAQIAIAAFIFFI